MNIKHAIATALVFGTMLASADAVAQQGIYNCRLYDKDGVEIKTNFDFMLVVSGVEEAKSKALASAKTKHIPATSATCWRVDKTIDQVNNH